MSYAITDIINGAKICQALAAIGEPKAQALKLGSFDIDLHIKLYVERMSLEYAYAQDPASDETYQIGQWVLALCGAYWLTALLVSGSGGSISPIVPDGGGGSNSFPIYITNSDFDSATDYIDERLESENIIIFLNEINRYLIPNLEFIVSGDTLTITLAGFDASVNSYNLVIERYNTAA